MIPLPLARLAEVLDGRVLVEGTFDPEVLTVSEVMTDTRVPARGPALFVALRSASGDGHVHLARAGAAGAVAAVVDDVDAPCPLPRLVVDDTWRALRALAVAVHRRVAPRTVAITGSFGKTTTKDLTAAAVGASLRVASSPGSFNNELGVPLTMLSSVVGTEVLVAEVGARHPGDIATMAALLAPDVAIVTAVAGVHLGPFGSIEAIARTKGELVDALGETGVAVLNGDDPRVRAMADRAPSALMVSALGAVADVSATSIELDARGHARIAATTPWGDVTIRLPLAGRHHVTNALLALACAGILGVDPARAAGGIEAARTSEGRSLVSRADEGWTVIDDSYNASPPTVTAALRLLAEIPVPGRRWAVLGRMAELGPTSAEQHRAVGAIVAEHGIDRLVVVGAQTEELADGAVAAGLDPASVDRVATAEEALALVLRGLVAGDAVLVKGSRVVGLERVARPLLDGDPAGAMSPVGDGGGTR